jgi:hypothetical protein
MPKSTSGLTRAGGKVDLPTIGDFSMLQLQYAADLNATVSGTLMFDSCS